MIRAALAGCALASAACASVPVLTFESDDAAADAIPPDAPVLAEADAISDGPLDAPAPDASVDGGCPDQVPSVASVCCGAVACNGNCTTAECTLCQMMCGPATLCCARTNTIACRAPGLPCP